MSDSNGRKDGIDLKYNSNFKIKIRLFDKYYSVDSTGH